MILLLPPGMESHSYDPSPADMIAIQNADIFLYTGQYMEGWAADVLEGMESDTYVVDVSAHISLVREEEIEEEYKSLHMEEGMRSIWKNIYMTLDIHIYDPHIWTNPVYAMIMVEDIAEALMACDPSTKKFTGKMQTIICMSLRAWM